MSLTLFASLFSCNSPPPSETDAEKITPYDKMSYQEMIAQIHTPEEVQDYISHYITKEEEEEPYAYSFRLFHERRKGDCSEAVVAAAALLIDDGYPPYALIFRSHYLHSDKHGIFVYEREGYWGSLGINNSDVIPPFYTLEKLAAKFGMYREYAFVRLSVEDFPGWISGSEDLNRNKRFFGLQPVYKRIER
ncbi:MAG: hypothetical protein Q8R18_03245 [bacterium]|nr:hypothetical protein [bacterium]